MHYQDEQKFKEWGDWGKGRVEDMNQNYLTIIITTNYKLQLVANII